MSKLLVYCGVAMWPCCHVIAFFDLLLAHDFDSVLLFWFFGQLDACQLIFASGHSYLLSFFFLTMPAGWRFEGCLAAPQQNPWWRVGGLGVWALWYAWLMK